MDIGCTLLPLGSPFLCCRMERKDTNRQVHVVLILFSIHVVTPPPQDTKTSGSRFGLEAAQNLIVLLFGGVGDMT